MTTSSTGCPRLIDDLLTLARADRPDFLRSQPSTSRGSPGWSRTARGLDEREWTVDGSARVVAMVDGQRLTEAVLQLAENAVRYSPAGGPVAIGSRDRGRRDPDLGPRPWAGRRPRGAATASSSASTAARMSRRTEGSGLGLSIVAAIAEAHGGSVRA